MVFCCFLAMERTKKGFINKGMDNEQTLHE